MIQISNLWILKILRNIFKMDLEMCKKNIRSSMVKTIFESDALLRNYHEKTRENYMRCIPACARQPCQLVSGAVWWNTQLGERFLCVDELTLIHPTTNFYVTSRPKLFCAAWSGFLYIRLAVSAVVPHSRARQLCWPEWVGWLGPARVWVGWLAGASDTYF
jgi:hypothetical protein